MQTLFITKVSFTTLVTSGRSGALSARGVSSNGSGAMYHQIQNQIIAQTAKTKRMSLPYASTSASSSRKLLIRDASSRLSGDLLAKRESLGTYMEGLLSPICG